MIKKYLSLGRLALSATLAIFSISSLAAKSGQFVRIELPKGGQLTLAEVEIISGGKNVAPKGKAKQSSTTHGGEAKRAIDGNKNGDYGKNGQTHTGEDKPAWWELDLGTDYEIDAIQIWNRSMLQERLDNFTVTVFDLTRETVYKKEGNPAPAVSVKFDLKKPDAKPAYVDAKGKPMKPGVPKPAARPKAPSPLGLWALAKNEVPGDYRDPDNFSFQEGDTIALIGNALAERTQYDGWLETTLQSQEKGKKLRFRNLAISGDRVDSFPRSRGFMTLDAYLQHIEANVVFAFFGYNESFNESAGTYGQKLQDFVQKVRATKPADQFPRIVLFSPIAHEDLGSPNLPKGKANNKRLEEFAKATEAAAAATGVTYVDLFNPTLALYESEKEPLTINGVHLNALGNRLLAGVISEAVTGNNAKSASGLESLREAVNEKDLQWFDRYRAVDGNDIWGGRSGLRFVGDQTNADVLRHELIQLDVMTANRDAKVWARANGKDHKVDDSNVPADIPVVSNVGGKGRMSSSQKEGTVQYLSPCESVKAMDVPGDFQINVFADETRFPELVNPVQMQVDGKGRLWVAAWTNYPKQAPLGKTTDKLLIFEDTDRDGVADDMKVFAEIPNPLGFEFWGGGVVVSSQPNLVFLKDTDGDDKADHSEILLHGIGSSDTHHACNNLIYGPDGGIYWQSGIFLQNNFEHPWGSSLATGSSAMYRFDPRRFTISHHGGNSPNPHGISFDRWGYHYATDGTGGRAYQVRPDGKGWKMHGLLKKEVRPVPASEILSSAHFPEEMQQHFLICNSIGFLGIKQYKLDRGGKGSERKLGEVWGEPSGADLKVNMGGKDMSSKGLLLSGDKNFRPTDAIVGEDGALYVSDWANVIIGHMQHNIRDPHRDHKHGRVIRITHKERPLQKPVKIAGQPIPALLENLKHPVDGVRHRTRVELSGRDSKEVIAATKKWAAGFDPADEKEAHHLLEALWLHQQHNVRDAALLNKLLKSPNQHVSVAANTVQHHWYNADPALGSPAIEEDQHVADTVGGIASDTADLTTIDIATLVEKMKYNVKSIDVKAGKKIKIVFSNPDFLPHNLLVVKPKTADKVAAAAVAMGAEGFAKGFRPDSSDILAGTKMLDNGQKETIEFTLPGKGDYEIVCTFPGHHILMRATLRAR